MVMMLYVIFILDSFKCTEKMPTSAELQPALAISHTLYQIEPRSSVQFLALCL